jgi:serine protease Do
VVITNVTPDSPADLAGLTTSMAIVQVNRKPVKNVEEFERALKERSADDGVLLLVRTQQGSRFVVIRSEG